MMSNQFWYHPNIDFTPTYYFCLDRKGCRSHLQTILVMEYGEEFLRILVVDVMDATLGGNLPQFRKVQYEDVL
jgi:hypothetical protein